MKVQSYKSTQSYIQKSYNFLMANEATNNLFWEIIKNHNSKNKNLSWGANIYENGKIILSALLTESEYILVSHGKLKAVERLQNYLKRKNVIYKGLCGPTDLVDDFKNIELSTKQKIVHSKKDFKIFISDLKMIRTDNPINNGFSLKIVGKNEWPRARHWAMQFAFESEPKLDSARVISLANEMRKSKNLFFLEKEKLGTCAMVGIRRETENYMIINLVFVPKEFRGQQCGRHIIYMIMMYIYKKYNKMCLLFSDYKGKDNLYDKVGFKHISDFTEISLINQK